MKASLKGDDERFKKAAQTLLTYVSNIGRSPDEEKFRRLRLNNAAFQQRVGSVDGGVRYLELCGFVKSNEGGEGGDEILIMPREGVNLVVLEAAAGELNSAITNPFFGILS